MSRVIGSVTNGYRGGKDVGVFRSLLIGIKGLISGDSDVYGRVVKVICRGFSDLFQQV